MRIVWRSVFLSAPLVAGLSSCSGGSGPTPPPSASPPVATMPPTTTTTVAAAPVDAVLVHHFDRGQSPFAVGFDMCQSTDSAGAAGDTSNLAYFADFDEGAGSVEQENCAFAHTFRTDGVDRLNLQFCVQDRTTMARDCEDSSLEVAAQIDINVNRSNNLACQGIVRASANVVHTATRDVRALGADVRALGAIDRMQFIARSGGQEKTKEGQQSGGGWETGDWDVGFTAGVEVLVRPFSGDLEGWEVADARPGCN